MNSIQRQYIGFKKTSVLWNGSILDLHQIDFQKNDNTPFQGKKEQKLRLGKLVEQFVSHELQNSSSTEILLENIQIQDKKLTIGELDCLLLENGKPTHLEIVYKFYLYDKSVGNSEIEHWIGPNRRDSFIQKLTKLKEKQLPLLYNEKTKPYLDKINLSSEEFVQKVYFKAQLFIHLSGFKGDLSIINKDCIYGFYVYAKELKQLSSHQFYIPDKRNWLVDVHNNVNWKNFQDFNTELNSFLSVESSPLCWLKKPNNELIKFFVVWW